MTVPEVHAYAADETLPFVWETDPRGMNHYQSPSWYRYIGEDYGSSFGEDWLRFYHPDDRGYLEAEWRKALATGGAHRYDVEVRIRRYDGAYRWFRVQGTPVRSSSGEVVKWVGSCIDIDAEKRASDAPTTLAPPPVAADLAPPQSGSWRDLLRLGTLQRRLFAIVLIGLLPLAVLSFATLVYTASKQRDQVIAAADNALSAVLGAVDSEIALTWASLDALTASPRLAREDWATFHEEAVELLARRPSLANIILSTPNAVHVVNARIPYGQPLPSRIDPETVDAVVRTGMPKVGNVVFGPAIGSYGFAVAVPVKRGNDVAYVLSAPVRPDSIAELLRKQRLPEQGVVSVADARYNIVARSLNAAAFVGKPLSPSLLAVLQENSKHENGWAVTTTLEGVPVYTVYRRSPLTGWSAAVGLPKAVLDAPVRRSYGALGGAIVLSVLLGLAAALIAARSVTRPMRELEQAAAAAARGDLPVEPRTALPEVQKVAGALIAAHAEREKLLHREREARLLERDARLAAENASRAKDELLAMLGHELRNPLAAINNAAQILERADAPRAAVGQAKAIIRRQALHLGRITDDLLDAGRVMMGKITLARTPLELATLVDQVVTTLRNTGRLADHRLQVRTSPVWIEADPTRMEQVISNLLVNAIKYTPAGAQITVATERHGSEALLRVRDEGIGLEPELLPRVFDLFVQGPRSIERAEGGLGIGLTLVRRLVTLHGGRVEANSEGPGKGSEFVVHLPAIDAPKVEQKTQGAAAEGRRKVVIVEDNADARLSLRFLLELEGHEVHEAPDGPRGVEAVVRERPDVALIDIGLPGMDGYAVARAARAQVGPGVRLVAVTGYGQKDGPSAADSAFDDYLVKPVDPAVLERVLAEAATVHAHGAPRGSGAS